MVSTLGLLLSRTFCRRNSRACGLKRHNGNVACLRRFFSECGFFLAALESLRAFGELPNAKELNTTERQPVKYLAVYLHQSESAQDNPNCVFALRDGETARFLHKKATAHAARIDRKIHKITHA